LTLTYVLQLKLKLQSPIHIRVHNSMSELSNDRDERWGFQSPPLGFEDPYQVALRIFLISSFRYSVLIC